MHKSKSEQYVPQPNIVRLGPKICYTIPMKKLYRSSDNSIVSGVAGGVAEYYEVDPVIVRLVGLFIAVITGIFPFALLYIIAALVVPKKIDVTVHDKSEPTI